MSIFNSLCVGPNHSYSSSLLFYETENQYAEFHHSKNFYNYLGYCFRINFKTLITIYQCCQEGVVSPSKGLDKII